MAHEATYRPEPHVRTPIPVHMMSKNWKPEDLYVGRPVFYRGERYYIEICPKSWEDSAHVRISDKRIRPEPGMYPPEDRQTFYVHPDLLTEAPEGKNKYGRQPTEKAIKAKAEREAKGLKDAGDQVADILRGCDLDMVYALAADFLNEPEEELRTKAGHLNNGQQRMWCGNRMRAYMKKLAAQNG
jgi:hypothetical protein